MLYTDGEFITGVDLAGADPEAPKVSASVGIALDSSGSSGGLTNICGNACDQLGQKLRGDLQSIQGYLTPWAVPYNQAAAVLNATLPSVNRIRVYLSQIVVSNPAPGYSSPVKNCAIYWALWLLYRAAWRRYVGVNKDADRWKARMEEYEREWKDIYYPRFFRIGLPVVYKPLPSPGATHEIGSGVWSAANVATVSGTNANQQTSYDVAVTWIDTAQGYISPTNKGTGESAPSALITINVPTNQVLQISIASLNPPIGNSPLTQEVGQGLFIFGNATGWNLYVGLTGGPLYLQNASPIAVGTKTYTLAGAPVLSGNIADSGQLAQATYTLQRTIDRA